MSFLANKNIEKPDAYTAGATRLTITNERTKKKHLLLS